MLLKYRIAGKQDISYPGTPRMTYRVVFSVEQVPSRADIERTVKGIWRNEGKKFAVFTVWGYLPQMDTQSLAYVTAEFTPAGMKKLQIARHAVYGTKWWDLVQN